MATKEERYFFFCFDHKFLVLHIKFSIKFKEDSALLKTGIILKFHIL